MNYLDRARRARLQAPCVDCGETPCIKAGDNLEVCQACEAKREDARLEDGIAQEDYRKEYPRHAGY